MLALDADFVCLQRDMRAADLTDFALAGGAIRFVGDALGDFADTACLAALVDHVVAVDTAVAHLAGALGRPTSVVLPYAPDFRWMLGRDDSPWYPTMRLYRQGRPLDWSGAITHLRDDLALALNPGAGGSRPVCAGARTARSGPGS